MNVKYKSRVIGFLTIVFVLLVGFNKIVAQNTYLTGPTTTTVGAIEHYYLNNTGDIMNLTVYWGSDGIFQGQRHAVFDTNVLWNSPEMHHWVDVFFYDGWDDTYYESLEVNVIGATPSKITFDYDTAGNQTIRELCLSCTKPGYKTKGTKEVVALQEEDLQKFYPEDVISYYPNPVKEELYLKWELVIDKAVSSVYLYALNGQVLKTYNNLEKTNSLNIPFLNFPTGAYLVVLVYNDGEQKTIKIVK
jgi:hypothetical protein